jgi:hypothetical protein
VNPEPLRILKLVEAAVLQKLGGWSDLRMVMNYAHHSPGFLASFVNNTMEKP